MFVYVCVYINTSVYMCKYICVCICIYKYIYIYNIYIYIYIDRYT